MRLGFLASHGGSLFEACVHAIAAERLDAAAVALISNNSSSRALEVARKHGVASRHLSGKTHPEPQKLDMAISSFLEERGVELVLLAGYMRQLGPATLARFKGRVLNTHPSLLPDFGGTGMYGQHVHEAVLASGRTHTGVTIHVVDERYDTGPIVAQTSVSVVDDDTAQTLAERVQATEREFLPATLQRIADGTLILPISNPK